MSNVFNRSDFTVTVKKQGGKLLTTNPITVKNQVAEIRAIDDIPGVNNAQKVDGSTLIYNANTGQYDIKPYNSDPLLNVENLYVSSLWANNSRGSNGQVLFTNGNTAYWANGVTKILAGTGLAGGGQGEEVTLYVNSAYIATITSNNASFAYGKREENLSVNFALYAGDANFSYLANNAFHAYGKDENELNVNSANNATFAYGKREENLSVNFALYSGFANFAYTANSAQYINGKGEGSLAVNTANYAENSGQLNGRGPSYYTNASNIDAGTLDSARLPNTAVTAGQYGSPSQIPVITVDQYGRINAISTSAVAGVTGYTYSSSNNTFRITTGDGSAFDASFDTVKDLNITGNLVVSGTTTVVNTEILDVKDPVITLNTGQVTPFSDIGILMQRYAVANTINYNVAFGWDEDSRELRFGKALGVDSNNELLFTQNWIRFDEMGNAIALNNVQAGNAVVATSHMVINSVSFNEVSYPGQANTALYFNGVIDCGEY